MNTIKWIATTHRLVCRGFFILNQNFWESKSLSTLSGKVSLTDSSFSRLSRAHLKIVYKKKVFNTNKTACRWITSTFKLDCPQNLKLKSGSLYQIIIRSHRLLTLPLRIAFEYRYNGYEHLIGTSIFNNHLKSLKLLELESSYWTDKNSNFIKKFSNKKRQVLLLEKFFTSFKS